MSPNSPPWIIIAPINSVMFKQGSGSHPGVGLVVDLPGSPFVAFWLCWVSSGWLDESAEPSFFACSSP
ncbi:hypothetical protein MHSWG343_06840 [Candidatus Mycoplasma haematohominis]|uniref:Uncharacterized protein n=1 Tax=Candidatus Mycoplasma haematohominis TaxID=1494318 RepID=A0A478FRK2_9MOLU|nr:hypothetical protein MHSWG343_06840 [Candidatus Mycoplasma haemohominis]